MKEAILLQTPRLCLRPFTEEDVDAYYAIASDLEVERYLKFAFPRSKEQCREMVEDYVSYDFLNNFGFLICKKDTGDLVGALIAFRLYNSVIEVIYFIGKDYRGNHYAAEALQEFIQYLAESTKYSHLFFYVERSNEASRKVLSQLSCSMHPNQIYYYYPLRLRNHS